jgi:hypothetical protein
MSTYVLMRILEPAPNRYDLGIRLLTFGGVDRRTIASLAASNPAIASWTSAAARAA